MNEEEAVKLLYVFNQSSKTISIKQVSFCFLLEHLSESSKVTKGSKFSAVIPENDKN